MRACPAADAFRRIAHTVCWSRGALWRSSVEVRAFVTWRATLRKWRAGFWTTPLRRNGCGLTETVLWKRTPPLQAPAASDPASKVELMVLRGG